MSRLLQPKAQYRSLLATKPLTAILSRSFCASKRSMVAEKDISPSQGENASDLAAQATSLVDSGRWNLWNNGKGLERQFKFKTFKATWDFMNAVAAECKKQKHHPEWTNVFNKTHIRWTTHNPEGLSGKDTSMARFCDEAGKEFGEAEPEEEVGSCYGPPGKKEG